MNIKNEKGSITLFVLASCMFFIASVVCTNIYMQSQQSTIDKEYKQIKANYEKDINNMELIYNNLAQLQESVEFADAEIYAESHTIQVNTTINAEPETVKSIKYGWLFNSELVQNPPSSSISNWTYIEKTDENITFNAVLENVQTAGYYYLCVIVNNHEFWKTVPLD